LQYYFLTNRQIRNNNFPIRILDSLLRVAIAHAKLCLREEVDIVDSLFAIELIEDQILKKFGTSILGFTTTSKSHLQSYGNTSETQYKNFYKHINQLCQIHHGIKLHKEE